MADDALLSDLCSICNTAQFKYRCPGCSARTCSLPCYKRHQQWAQCDGKRDPTKFVKKSQLATPAGIDHDYNFLTGIERGLEKAEKQLEDQGLGNHPDPRHDSKGRPPTQQRLATVGVTVIRAPKGLSRQKDNKTHQNKKHIVWTVEWIYEDSNRILTQSSSVCTILQSQPFKKESKKRKRGTEQSTLASTSEPVEQDVAPPISSQEQANNVETEHSLPEPAPPGGSEPERVNPSTISGDETTRDTANAKKEEGTSDHHGSVRVDGPGSEPIPPKYAFYLLRPRTSSNRHVLIRLDPMATLAECLRGRTVLEFPTVYVFPELVSPPSEKFMLEAEYLQQESEEQKELEDLLKHVDPKTLRALKHERGDNSDTGEQIDSDRILDVLKQDFGAGV